jgi:hypothetical protein
MGNFGNAVAQPAQAVNVQRLDVSSGQQALADAAGGIVNDMAARNTALQQAQMRAQTSLKLASLTNDLHSVHDDVARGVADGSIDPDQARATFEKQAGKLQGDALEGYQPEMRTTMQAHTAGVIGGLQRNLDGVVMKRRQADTGATVDAFGEQMQREFMRAGGGWAYEKFSAMVDFAGPAAGWSPEQIATKKQAFKERATWATLDAQGTDALTRGDLAGVQAARLKVQGPEGEALDPLKRVQLTHQLFGYEQHIIAQQRAAANRADADQFAHEKAAADIFNQGTDIALGGGYFSPDFIKQMTEVTAGTKMQGAAANLLASQATVAGFASLPAPQRTATLERLRAERANPVAGTDPLNEKLLGAMKAMDDKLTAAAKDNPWEAAQQASVIKDAPTFNAADPSSTVQIVQQRMQQIGRVEAWAGHKVSPLQPAEVDQLSKIVRTLPLDQSASMLGKVGEAMGDSERVAALAKQLHDKDGALGLAMMYANAGTTEGRRVAELVLRGDQAIRDKSVMVDRAQETGWAGAIAKQIRGAYSNREAEDATIDAAFKIAAANYAKDGSPDIERAVRLATGGITERNGAKVPLPYGMAEKDFNTKLQAITPDDLAAQAPGGMVQFGGVPMRLDAFVQALPKASLVHAGQGRYNVRAGTGLVTNQAGERITIKVGP